MGAVGAPSGPRCILSARWGVWGRAGCVLYVSGCPGRGEPGTCPRGEVSVPLCGGRASPGVAAPGAVTAGVGTGSCRPDSWGLTCTAGAASWAPSCRRCLPVATAAQGDVSCLVRPSALHGGPGHAPVPGSQPTAAPREARAPGLGASSSGSGLPGPATYLSLCRPCIYRPPVRPFPPPTHTSFRLFFCICVSVWPPTYQSSPSRLVHTSVHPFTCHLSVTHLLVHSRPRIRLSICARTCPRMQESRDPCVLCVSAPARVPVTVRAEAAGNAAWSHLHTKGAEQGPGAAGGRASGPTGAEVTRPRAAGQVGVEAEPAGLPGCCGLPFILGQRRQLAGF